MPLEDLCNYIENKPDQVNKISIKQNDSNNNSGGGSKNANKKKNN